MQNVRLDLALEQVVGWLDGIETGCGTKALHLCGRKIADADGADFTLLAQVRQRPSRLLDRRLEVGPVHLI